MEDTPYTPEYVGPEKYDMYETSDKIIDHLKFYKAIISEGYEGEKLDYYMDIVNKMKYGAHLSLQNEFDRAIALIFELVIQHHMNPWDVNLLKFSKLYTEKIKDDEDIDFIAAGKLMYMAWSVLKLQSDEVIANNSSKIEDDVKGTDIDVWQPYDADWLMDDESFAYTSSVIHSTSPPITESIRRKSVSRPVTLYELIEAFEEARHEVEVQMILRRKRSEERKRLGLTKLKRVNGMMHKENIMEDMMETWKRIKDAEGKIPLSKIILPNSLEDRITTFISVLFLAFKNKINIYQENFPYGEIYIEKIAEEIHINDLKDLESEKNNAKVVKKKSEKRKKKTQQKKKK